MSFSYPQETFGKVSRLLIRISFVPSFSQREMYLFLALFVNKASKCRQHKTNYYLWAHLCVAQGRHQFTELCCGDSVICPAPCYIYSKDSLGGNCVLWEILIAVLTAAKMKKQRRGFIICLFILMLGAFGVLRLSSSSGAESRHVPGGFGGVGTHASAWSWSCWEKVWNLV